MPEAGSGGLSAAAPIMLHSDSNVHAGSLHVAATHGRGAANARAHQTDPIDDRLIRDMNSSILQAAEIQNRIKKVHQLEVSPLIDTYNSLNEPHAHPMGLLSGMNQ